MQRPLRIMVPAGIGDVLWIYSKLVNLGVPLDVSVSADNPPRAQPLVELLPAVKAVNSRGWPYHRLKGRAVPPATLRAELLRATADGSRKLIEFNTFLDAGNRIEGFFPDLPVDHHYPINISPERVAQAEAAFPTAERYIGIFCASRGGISNWKAWDVQQWVDFLLNFRVEFGDMRVAVLGAGWDVPFAAELMAGAQNAGLTNLVDLTGKIHIGATLHILRKAAYFVGFPSGLSVLAHVLKTPATMFYPDVLHLMPGAWVDPEMISSHTFREVLYSKTSPEEVVRWLRDVYGTKRLLG